MSKKITIAILIVTALVAGIFLLQKDQKRESQTGEKIKVGVVPSAYYLPIFVAKEKGFLFKYLMLFIILIIVFVLILKLFFPIK